MCFKSDAIFVRLYVRGDALSGGFSVNNEEIYEKGQ